jgi:chemotaxis protein MotA
MDIASLVGLILMLVAVIGVGIGSNIPQFIDGPSMGIVLLGTIGATLLSFPMPQVVGLVGVIKGVFLPTASVDLIGGVKQLVELATISRKDGILALEPKVAELTDEFLKKGLQLAVDGTDAEAIRDIMENEINGMESRHKGNIAVLAAIAALGPAMGMIGTLVGLVLMLANMADPSALGPAMAVAMITTFYGAVIANMFFLPFVNKLSTNSAAEVAQQTMVLEGILGLASGTSPNVLQMKMSTFLSPKEKVLLEADNKK